MHSSGRCISGSGRAICHFAFVISTAPRAYSLLPALPGRVSLHAHVGVGLNLCVYVLTGASWHEGGLPFILTSVYKSFNSCSVQA